MMLSNNIIGNLRQSIKYVYPSVFFSLTLSSLHSASIRSEGVLHYSLNKAWLK